MSSARERTRRDQRVLRALPLSYAAHRKMKRIKDCRWGWSHISSVVTRRLRPASNTGGMSLTRLPFSVRPSRIAGVVSLFQRRRRFAFNATDRRYILTGGVMPAGLVSLGTHGIVRGPVTYRCAAIGRRRGRGRFSHEIMFIDPQSSREPRQSFRPWVDCLPILDEPGTEVGTEEACASGDDDAHRAIVPARPTSDRTRRRRPPGQPLR